MLLFLALVATAVLASWVSWRVKNRNLLECSRLLPGPPALPFLGNALSFMVPSEELSNVVGEMLQKYGDRFRFWLGPELNIIISDPSDFKSLLTNPKTSHKGPTYKYIAEFCGQGILSGSGPTWRKRRKIVNPNYGKKAIQSYEEVFNREADMTLERLRNVPAGKTFDIYEDVVRGTTYTVCQTLIGLTREQSVALPHLESIITKSHELQTEFVTKILEMGDYIVKERLKVLDGMDERKKLETLAAEGDDKQNTDLTVVDRLVLSKQIPEYDEILKEIFTLFTSSQEATAKITSYLLQMMAYHPDCQEKMYAEIQRVFGDSDRDVVDDDIKNMTYLDMAFKEVIRLFPIGVMLQRTVIEDIKLDKITLPAGCSLLVPLHHIQRDKRYWTDPHNFIPERFSPGSPAPVAYIPFSLGPMDCLGRYFGEKLVKTASVKILREFRLTSPERYEDMRLVMAVSVASVNGYPIQLHPRKSVKTN